MLHITVNQLCGKPINIVHAHILFCPLYYDIISLKSLKASKHLTYYLGLQKIKPSLGILKFEMSIAITKGLDNGDSDN